MTKMKSTCDWARAYGSDRLNRLYHEFMVSPSSDKQYRFATRFDFEFCRKFFSECFLDTRGIVSQNRVPFPSEEAASLRDEYQSRATKSELLISDGYRLNLYVRSVFVYGFWMGEAVCITMPQRSTAYRFVSDPINALWLIDQLSEFGIQEGVLGNYLI